MSRFRILLAALLTVLGVSLVAVSAADKDVAKDKDTAKDAVKDKDKAPPAEKKSVQLTLMVPAEAEVELDGYKTKTTGTTRVYESDPVEVGKTYNYSVKVTYKGQTITEKVSVSPDKPTTLDLTSKFTAAPKDKDATPKDKDKAPPKDKDAAPKDKDKVAPKDKDAAPKDKDKVAPKDKDAAPKDKDKVTPPKDKDAPVKDKDAPAKDK